VTDHWPTFNVADIAICVGVALMAIDMFTAKRGRRVVQRTPDPPVIMIPSGDAPPPPPDETSAGPPPGDDPPKPDEQPPAATADS
jgi:signal peptidase II